MTSKTTTVDWSELDRLVAAGDAEAALAWCRENNVPPEVAANRVGAIAGPHHLASVMPTLAFGEVMM